MALDSAAKRAYAIGVGVPAPTVYAEPDGTIGAADRGNIAWSYLIDVEVTRGCAVGSVMLTGGAAGTVEGC